MGVQKFAHLLHFSLGLALFLAACSSEIKSKHEALGPQASGVIYGADSREESGRSPSPIVKALSPLSVALVNLTDLRRINNESYELLGKTFQREQKLCPSERFGNQRTAAFCSGILVGTKYVLTAGHCITSMRECNSTAFVFGYELPVALGWNYSVARHQIFTCSKIIAQKGRTGLDRNVFRSVVKSLTDEQLSLDFAIIELDRPVTNQVRLNLGSDLDLQRGAPMFVLGYPSGLPKKIADGQVLSNPPSSLYFKTNLDTFGGNSGAPVFNAQNGALEGILITGEEDYRDTNSGCRVLNRCPQNGSGCDGERVLKISPLRRYLDF